MFLTTTRLIINGVRATKAKRGGRSVLLVPVTMAVPGVMFGSQGPVYYPAEELAANASAWDGHPVVIRHPFKNGKPISALSVEVWNAAGVGVLEGSKVNKRGQLGATAVLDPARLEDLAPEIYDAVTNGRKVEVSTGLIPQRWEEAPAGSVDHKGREYRLIARDLHPEHLALLPDEVGACSINDGCGLLVANARPKTIWVPVANTRRSDLEVVADMIDEDRLHAERLARRAARQANQPAPAPDLLETPPSLAPARGVTADGLARRTTFKDTKADYEEAVRQENARRMQLVHADDLLVPPRVT